MNLPENLRITDRDLNAIIDIVYSRAKDILNTPLHLHYTDHSIEHSERILLYVDKLICPPKLAVRRILGEQLTDSVDKLIGDTSFLNEAEKFIIVCAILLHDIGMQTPKYADITTSFPLKENELEEIRKKHHEFSEEMIIDSVNLKSENRYYLGLESKREYVDNIAIIAKSHRKVDIASLEDDVVGSYTIRRKLLASLIRLGDCLDMDFRRVKIDKLDVLPIPTESKFFWYSHQYVKAITIDSFKIGLVIAFPETYKSNQSITKKITDYIENEIKKQINEVYPFLDLYNLRLSKDIDIKTQGSRTAKLMPDDLLKFIESSHNDDLNEAKENDTAMGFVCKIENNYIDFCERDFTLSKIELNTDNEADMFDVQILYKDRNRKQRTENNLEDFLYKHRSERKPILLFGNGGDGKTYSLYKFWKKYTKNAIYIRLYALGKQENSIMSYIEKEIFKSVHAEYEEFKRYYSTQNKLNPLFLLLDGFNEVADIDLQQQILSEVKSIRTLLNVQIVITSRYVDILNIRELNFDFLRAEMKGLTKEQISDCLIKFYEKQNKSVDINTVLQDKGIMKLFESPLMLSLYMQTSPYYDPMFPNEHLFDLYNSLKFVGPVYSESTIIWNYIQSEVLKTERTNKDETIFGFIVANFVSPLIAYEMQKKKAYAFSSDDLTDLLEKCSEYCKNVINNRLSTEFENLKRYYVFKEEKLNKDDLLDFMLKCSNPLLVSNSVVTSGKDTTYGFFHQQLRDCLAAIYLINELKFAKKCKSTPTVWAENFSGNLYMVRHVAFLENRNEPERENVNYIFEKLRLINSQTSVSQEIYNDILKNVLLVYKYAFESKLWKIDFSKVDLRNVSLDEFDFQPPKPKYPTEYIPPINSDSFDGAIFGAKTFALKGHMGGVGSLDTSGDKLLSADEYSVRLWSIGTIKCIDILYLAETPSAYSISACFLPNNDDIIAYSSGRNIEEITLGISMSTIYKGSKIIRNISYSPNGKFIMAVTEDGNVTVWERKGERNIIYNSDFNDTVYVKSNCSDDLVAVGFASEIQLINYRQGKVISKFNIGNDDTGSCKITALSFNALNQSMLAVGYMIEKQNDKSKTEKSIFIDIIYLDDSKEKVTLSNVHTKEITELKFSPDGELLGSCSLDYNSKITDLSNTSDVVTLGIRVPFTSISFMKNRNVKSYKQLFSGDKSGNISLDVVHLGTTYITNDYNGKSSIVFGISINPRNSKYCVAAYDDGYIRKWNIDNGQLEYTYPQKHSESVQCVAYSPDGSYFASGSSDSTIILWNTHDNTFIKSFKGHTGSVCDLTFSQMGNLIISCSTDGTIRIWNIESETSDILYTHNDNVFKVLYYEDENICRLIASSRDGYVFLWNFNGIMAKDNEIEPEKIKAHERRILSLCLSRFNEQTTFLSNSDDGKIQEWYMENGKPTGRRVEINKGSSEAIDYNFDSNTILFDCDSSNWRPFQKAHLDQCELPLAETSPRSIWTFDNNNPSGENTLDIDKINPFDDINILPTDESKSTLDYHTGSIYYAKYINNYSQILSGSLDGSIVVYDLSKKEVVHRMVPDSDLSKKLKGYNTDNIVFNPEYIKYQYTGINKQADYKEYEKFAKALNRGVILNLFDFIKSEADIEPLVNVFIDYTEGLFSVENKINQERHLLLSNILYLYLEAPDNEQNMLMLSELIIAGMDLNEDQEDYETDLDRLFNKLEEKNKSHIALKKYRMHKEIRYGIKGIFESCYWRLYPLTATNMDSLLFPLKEDMINRLTDSFIANTNQESGVTVEVALLSAERELVCAMLCTINKKFDQEDKNDRFANNCFNFLKTTNENCENIVANNVDILRTFTTLDLKAKRQVICSILSRLEFFNFKNSDYNKYLKLLKHDEYLKLLKDEIDYEDSMRKNKRDQPITSSLPQAGA